MASSKIVIGVTGGVGAGKSTAEKLCCKLEVPAVDVDDFVHEILDGSESVKSAILERFKSQFNCAPLTENGLIDRKIVAEKAFRRRDFRLFLENLIHPLVKQRTLDWINLQINDKRPCSAVFAPLLFESGMDKMVDCTINISASAENRTDRLIKERNWTHQDIYARMEAQMDDDERCKRADYVVYNNGSIEKFKKDFKNTINLIISTVK